MKLDADRGHLGRIHRRAFPQAKRSVALLGHGQSTEYEWRNSGSPVLRYLSNANPWVVEAFLALIKSKHEVEKWPMQRVEERIHTLEADIMRAVGDTIRLTHTPDATLAEKMEADQALMELLAERGAVRLAADKNRQNGRGH